MDCCDIGSAKIAYKIFGSEPNSGHFIHLTDFDVLEKAIVDM